MQNMLKRIKIFFEKTVKNVAHGLGFSFWATKRSLGGQRTEFG